MKSFEIIDQMSLELVTEILGYLQNEQTPVYKSMVQALAGQRKLRPVFVERKPRDERYAWMKSALARKPSDAVAAHLLQAWLLGAEQAMLCAFLDSLCIAPEQDGNSVPQNTALHQ